MVVVFIRVLLAGIPIVLVGVLFAVLVVGVALMFIDIQIALYIYLQFNPTMHGNPPTIILKTNIKRTAERAVFFDATYIKTGAFFVPYQTGGGDTAGIWYDDSWAHGNGIVVSFADQHVEFHKWIDQPHHIKEHLDGKGWGQGTADTADCDLRWMVKVTWGVVPSWFGPNTRKCEF